MTVYIAMYGEDYQNSGEILGLFRTREGALKCLKEDSKGSTADEWPDGEHVFSSYGRHWYIEEHTFSD